MNMKMKSTPIKYLSISTPNKTATMYSSSICRITAVSLFLIGYSTLAAQPGLTLYTDLGENNVSAGLFIKPALLGHYTFGKNRVETGIETDLKSDNHPLLSGYTVNVSRYLLTRGSTFEIRGFGTQTRNSEFLRETNWGALVNMRHKRFEMALGTNFRTYAFRRGAIADYEISKNAMRVHENFNIMYSFGYYLKKNDTRWNAGLSLTNIDHFYISQETNALLCLQGFYKPGSQVSLFAEAWYKSAGAPNLAINHFGFFFRTGITWNFN
jgi:hypothetical protein